MTSRSENARELAFQRISERVGNILNFQFHEALPESSNTINGLCLIKTYLPEEIVVNILSFVNMNDILNCSLVCRKWCNIIKSQPFWAQKYYRKYNKKAKKLPWYVFYCLFSTNFFDVNLIKNGNGQEQLTHWKPSWGSEHKDIGVKIEDPPVGTDPLPDDVPEFNGCTSCFANSSKHFLKRQVISFGNNKLMIYVMNRFKPHIYASVWVAGRWGHNHLRQHTTYYLKSGLLYDLRFVHQSERPDRDSVKALRRKLKLRRNYATEIPLGHLEDVIIGNTEDHRWQQAELLVKEYPDTCVALIYQHQGSIWKKDDCIKVAGSVMKILFESIEPLHNNPKDFPGSSASGPK